MNTVLRWVVNIGLFLTLLTPLIVADGMFFPFITGKNFIFRILVEIAFAAWLVLALRDPEYRPRKSPILIGFSVLLFVLVLADAFGENPYRSFWSNYERMEGLISHLHFLAYFVMMISMLKTEKLWYRFFHTSIFVSIIQCSYAIYQILGYAQINQGGIRVDAKFGNATYLAVYLLFHIFFVAMYLVRYRSSRPLVVAYSLILLLQTYVLYYTATRGAILGVIGGAVLTALIVGASRPGIGRKVSFGFLGAVVLLVGIFISFRNSEFVSSSPVLRRFSSLQENTIRSREIIWSMSYQGFKEHPVLGWGQENYNIVFNKYYDPRLWGQEQWFDRSHNVLLDWLITSGIVGLLAYLSLFASALYLLYKADDSQLSLYDRALLVGVLAAYFVQNLTVFDNLTSYILFFAVLAYIHVRTQPKSEHVEVMFASVKITPESEQVVAGIIVASLLAMIYVGNVKPILTSWNLIQAISPQAGGITENFDYFKKTFAYQSFGTVEGREQLVLFASRVAAANDLPANIKREIVTLARDEILKQVDEAPTDARYRLFAGSLFSRLQFVDDAVAQLAKAVELSPKKQTLLFELGTAYLTKKDYQNAFEVMKKAYEFEPEFEEARKIYAVAAIYAGQDKVAEELLVPKYGTTVLNDDRFLLAFVSRNDFPKVIQIWTERVAANPGDARSHVALGAGYYANGEKKKGIKEFEEAIKIDPSIKAQIEERLGKIFK